MSCQNSFSVRWHRFKSLERYWKEEHHSLKKMVVESAVEYLAPKWSCVLNVFSRDVTLNMDLD